MNENGVSLSDRVEAILHMLCEELWEQDDEVRVLAWQSQVPEAGYRVPLQYLVCTLDLPQARQALRQTLPAWQAALDSLAALLQHTDEVWAEDSYGWAPYETLLTAPFPVQRPTQPDLRDWDVLLILERDSCFGGAWDGLMEWLHLQGSRANQADIQRIRQLAAFERAHHVNLRDVISRQVEEPASDKGPTSADC